MSDQHSPRNFEFSFGSATGSSGGASKRRLSPDALRILVIGDFSGRSSRAVMDAGSIATRPVLPVDVDDLDRAIGASQVSLHLNTPTGGAPLVINIAKLDEFHPEHVAQAVTPVAGLLDLRRRLLNPATFAEAAKQASILLGLPTPTPAAPAAAAPTPPESDFAALLAGKTIQSSPAGAVDISNLIKQIVQPHVVAPSNPQQADFVRGVEGAISKVLGAVMRHPTFQHAEAAWRGVHRLITTLESGASLGISIVDISREEITADLAAASRSGSLEKSNLHKLLVERPRQTPGAAGWGIVVGCFNFGRTVQDAVLLSGLAQVVRQAGAAFLAGAEPSLVGCPSFALTNDPDDWALVDDDAGLAGGKAWDLLRDVEDASHVALGMPRFLLRAPYGKGGETVDAFPFEELPQTPKPTGASEAARAALLRHESFLWGNPAFAIAEVLARAFLAEGPSMSPEITDDVEGIPVYSASGEALMGVEGEYGVKPSAEAWLTERAAVAMRRAGVTPLLSFKGKDAARIAGVTSVRCDELQGPWSTR